MKRLAISCGLFTAAVFGPVFSLLGAPVISTPDEAAIEKGSFQAVYERSETEPEVRVSGGSAIQIPTSSGNASVFSQSSADIELTRTAELVGLRFTTRPKQVRYTVFLGQLRSFDIEFSSGSDTNKFNSTDSGFAYGVGLAGSFVPTSVASVGFGWDIQYRQMRVDFERFVSAAGVTTANQKLVEDEFQAAVMANTRFGQVSPYAGLKVSRWITRLEDSSTGERIRGNKDGASAMVGLQWEPITGNIGFLEASFFEEESFSAGWGFGF